MMNDSVNERFFICSLCSPEHRLGPGEQFLNYLRFSLLALKLPYLVWRLPNG
jgi:hypothetical protein